MNYLVNEIFLTIQGEATFTGTPAVFIRLQGCKVGCAFCDTKHTWRINPANKVDPRLMLAKAVDTAEFAEIEADALADQVASLAGGTRHVVITGGEPADHDLWALSEELQRRGYRVQVETSGTSPLLISPEAWVTVSPKIAQAGGLEVRQDVMERADEIKHPTATQKHLDQLQALLALGWHRPGIPVWLQPLSQSRQATARCVSWCQEFGYRLSLQTHKYLGVR